MRKRSVTKRRYPERACEECGCLFRPTRSWQKYCNQVCRNAAGNAKLTKEYRCEYCGMLADTVDHIPPRHIRHQISELGIRADFEYLEVRVCLECNSLLGSRPIFTVAARREFVQGMLKKRYAGYLKLPRWASSELHQLSPHMQTHIQQGQVMQRIVEARITWEGDSYTRGSSLDIEWSDNDYKLWSKKVGVLSDGVEPVRTVVDDIIDGLTNSYPNWEALPIEARCVLLAAKLTDRGFTLPKWVVEKMGS